MIIQKFLQFENDRELEWTQRSEYVACAINPQALSRIKDSIHLAACGVNEILPMHPTLPADLFTACLTTPIKAALHWYVTQKNLCQLVPGLTFDLLDRIPGQINERRTMLGELNWIFTAITDTIAWNTLNTELFQKLFRQDLLVASLFRNYLLAERIMKSLDCNTQSSPVLPSTHEHPLWQSWDLALDMCLNQLPSVLDDKNPKEFESCGFFTEQIEIFDVWLRYNVGSQTPPEQLPIVLQVLLSQQHRLKALELLGKFLDFGSWAVSAALSVGIFPYVLKLVTTQPKELRPLLTFIWAKILAVDKSCQTELVRDNGHVYFTNILADPEVESNVKVYSAFVLSCIVDNFPSGQESAKQNILIPNCAYLISDKTTTDYKDPLLRQWCCICLGLCWRNYPEARWEGVRNNAHLALLNLLSDPVPEVRASAIFALSTCIECLPGKEASKEQKEKLDSEIVTALIRDYDSVPFVRRELIIALYYFMIEFQTYFLGFASYEPIINDSAIQSGGSRMSISSSFSTSSETSTLQSPDPNNSTLTSVREAFSPQTLNSGIRNNLLKRVWNLITELQRDPYPDVAELAQKVIISFTNHANIKKSTTTPQFVHTVDISRPSRVSRYSIGSLHSRDDEKHMHKDSSIQTEFVQWCSKYFLKPLNSTVNQTNHQKDMFAPENLDYHYRLLYNVKTRRARKLMSWKEPQNMDEITAIKHTSLPFLVKFHPNDDYLFVADHECNVNVYETKDQMKIKSVFSNITSKRVAKITSLKLLQTQYEPIVLTGSDDTVVRLYKPDLLSNRRTSLLTAFNAFSKTEKVNSLVGAGLILDWDDINGNLLCAGDSRYIRIWDMTKELYRDIPSETASCVSSLASDISYCIAGFGDGTVKLFDYKRSPNSSTIKYEHNAFVCKVFIHKNSNKLITASTYGDVNIIDLRNFKSILKFPLNSTPEPATVVEVHPQNELVAIANSNQTIKIFDFKAKLLSTIKHHEGFLSKRIALVSCLDWNFYKNELVFGSQDNLLSIFNCRDSNHLYSSS